MYVIHLIVLLNILGVMIDNKRFVFVFVNIVHLCQQSAWNWSELLKHFTDPANVVRICNMLLVLVWEKHQWLIFSSIIAYK
jgi:hypothetical protein